MWRPSRIADHGLICVMISADDMAAVPTSVKQRILVIASAFAPGKGSELGVGFHTVMELSKRHEVTVVTRPLWKEYVLADTGSEFGNYPNITIVYEDMGHFRDMFPPNRREPLAHIYWCLSVRPRVRQLMVSGRFDLVHYLTLSSIFVPPFVFYPRRIPLLWGPVGGGEFVPAPLLRHAPIGLRIRELVRHCAIYAATGFYSLSRWAGLLDEQAVLARTDESAKVLGPAVTVLPETGMDLDIPPLVVHRAADPQEGLKLCVIGSLTKRKNVPHAINVFCCLLDVFPGSILRIAGEGPELSALRAQVESLGLDEQVKFLGFIDRAAVRELFADSDLCLHFAFREGGSWAVFESLREGVPVCCFPYNGLRGIVTEANGIPIDASDYQASRIVDKIAAYFQNPRNRGEITGSLTMFGWARKIAILESRCQELIRKARADRHVD